MTELRTKIPDIKIVAKNLAKELQIMKFKITHSSALNLISRSLGFNNYNTYRAFDKTFDEKETSTKNELQQQNHDEPNKTFTNERLKEFPSLDDKFIKLKSIDNEYNIFLHKDIDDVYYLLFRLESSYTRRVYYCPEYDAFMLDIYPSYLTEIKLEKIEKKHLHSLFFQKLLHIKRTKNYPKEIIGDLMELMDKIFHDREELIQRATKVSESGLEELWQSKKESMQSY